ncbi:MAG TPA: DUF1707 domain-containing protein [Trebonia sp.]
MSDAERDLAVAELSEHFQAGRLSQDEFDDRSGQALQARTGTDLNTLFTDLPHRGTPPVPPVPGPVPDPLYSLDVPPRPGGFHVLRVVIACSIVATIASGLFGYHGHGHGAGFLIPVVILGLVFLRLTAAARRSARRR